MLNEINQAQMTNSVQFHFKGQIYRQKVEKWLSGTGGGVPWGVSA